MEIIETKKRKLSGDENQSASFFRNFKLIRVLREDARHKLITLHGAIGLSNVDTDEKVCEDAVIVLEKKAFDVPSLENSLRLTTTQETLHNDIYSTHDVYTTTLTENCADMKATLIYPATEKHIAKYTEYEPFIIHESQHLYESVTLPFITESSFSIKWVYNILEKKTESDRIITEDPDPEVGFIMVPDMKWDRQNVENLYTVAIVHKHGLRSIRDLRKEHLPLLENILRSGQTAIKEKFNITPEKLRVYFHYQPSYYHLHVHFTHVKYDAPGSDVLRAHLIQQVIDNIKMDSHYYMKTTLSFVVRENDLLYQKYLESGYFN